MGEVNNPRQDLRSGALFARFSKVLYASSEILEEAKGGVRARSDSTPRPLTSLLLTALAAWAPGSVHAACLRGGSASSASASPATSTGARPRDRDPR